MTDEAPDRLMDRQAWQFLGAVVLLSAAVRVAWVIWVQPPGESVFSDMGSYLYRARVALGYTSFPASRTDEMALFPYGVHSWYALLLYVFGPPAELCSQGRLGWTGGSLTLMGIVHALTSSLVAPFSFLAALEISRRNAVAALAGVLVAVWPQLVVFVGFFTSEAPFAVCVAASVWATALAARTGRYGWLAGLCLGIGMTFRPQMLLTALLIIGWFAVRKRQLARSTWATVASLALPVVLILGFSSVRFHHYTGRLGTISANGELARLMAVSDYKRVENDKGRGFTPPARMTRNGFKGTWVYKGKQTDEEPLTKERRRIWASKTWRERSRVLQRNVLLLFKDNPLWPERNAVRYAKESKLPYALDREWRLELLPWTNSLLVLLLPATVFGILRTAGRREPGAEVALLQVFTMLFAAAFFFGETRYRVPYDAVLIVLAVSAVSPAARSRDSPRVGYAVAAALLVFCIWVVVPW